MVTARWLICLLPGGLLAGTPEFRAESRPLAGGAELITVFGHLRGGADQGAAEVAGVPLVSVLRDTLGDRDPANDRLRYLWVFTSAPPNLRRRVAAALPFFYFRPALGSNGSRKPAPVLDLAGTSRNVWTSVAGAITQVMALDPNGAWVRSSTRSYRSNAADHRRAHLAEGLAVFSHWVPGPGAPSVLSEEEVFEIQARLTLAGQTLGGLVDAGHLPDAYHKQRTRTEETRGHNWELLRQRAEANGLYFEPFGPPSSRTHAIVWVAREDLEDPRRPFDKKFLGIANPYTDPRLRKWSGFSTLAWFDAQGRRLPGPSAGAVAKQLIPLALYSLEYPKVPLLVVDFRAVRAPKHREMLRRAANDAIIGVFGISRWGNWPYLAGSAAYNFVRSRQGDANNRGARLRSFAATRQWLTFDPDLDPALRAELLRRVEILGVNPLEESVFQQADLAQRQYAALLAYAEAPKGLEARLQKDRNGERTAGEHGWRARLGLRLATVASLGAYRHKEPDPASLVLALDRQRRALRGASTELAAGAPGLERNTPAPNIPEPSSGVGE